MVNFTTYKLYPNKKLEKISTQEKYVPIWMVNYLVLLVWKSFERKEMEQEIGEQKDKMKSDTFVLEGSTFLFNKWLCNIHWMPGPDR